jgi:hypothetical protein
MNVKNTTKTTILTAGLRIPPGETSDKIRNPMHFPGQPFSGQGIHPSHIAGVQVNPAFQEGLAGRPGLVEVPSEFKTYTSTTPITDVAEQSHAISMITQTTDPKVLTKWAAQENGSKTPRANVIRAIGARQSTLANAPARKAVAPVIPTPPVQALPPVPRIPAGTEYVGDVLWTTDRTMFFDGSEWKPSADSQAAKKAALPPPPPPHIAAGSAAGITT